MKIRRAFENTFDEKSSSEAQLRHIPQMTFRSSLNSCSLASSGVYLLCFKCVYYILVMFFFNVCIVFGVVALLDLNLILRSKYFVFKATIQHTTKFPFRFSKFFRH